MNRLLADTVRRRANFACEYCCLSETSIPTPFEIEHVVALQHGGPTAAGNLAYACLQCNRRKGPNIAGIDRHTSRTKLVRLFNPRRHRWTYHFAFDGPHITGRTPIGRVAVYVLAMNDRVRAELRAELIEEGLWPPATS